jgi:hypothetical protein
MEFSVEGLAGLQQKCKFDRHFVPVFLTALAVIWRTGGANVDDQRFTVTAFMLDSASRIETATRRPRSCCQFSAMALATVR